MLKREIIYNTSDIIMKKLNNDRIIDAFNDAYTQINTSNQLIVSGLTDPDDIEDAWNGLISLKEQVKYLNYREKTINFISVVFHLLLGYLSIFSGETGETGVSSYLTRARGQS